MTRDSVSHDSSRMVIATDPDFDPVNVTMRLYLTYDGCLLSTGNKTRPGHVHTIRKAFHKQLKHFWATNPFMKHLSERHPSAHPRAENIAHNYRINDYRFTPLVERKQALLCAIDVLYLRPTEHGGLIRRTGDIDGRLATLFDALAMPVSAEQLSQHKLPEDGEDPFFCLVADDDLITQVSVQTGPLLQETKDGLDDNAARIVVAVQLSPSVTLGGAAWT